MFGGFSMKIVDRLIEKFTSKILNDLEELSEELKTNLVERPVEQKMNKLHNDKVFHEMFKKQALLTVLRVF